MRAVTVNSPPSMRRAGAEGRCAEGDEVVSNSPPPMRRGGAEGDGVVRKRSAIKI